MSVSKQLFGTTEAGVDIFLYSIENTKGIKAQVMNYGAILVNLFVPDKAGKVEDVVLGYDKLEDYYENGSCFGATIGPVANRTKGAQFDIDGVTYQLDVNDNDNNLHSHPALGLHKKAWSAEVKDDNAVVFEIFCPDGEIGFPGNRTIKVTYLLTEENELKIIYEGMSDKKTMLNMTNHSYFNLSGHDSGDIHGEVLWMKASNYTPVVPGSIPTGEIASVVNTPMDFTTPKEIGLDINADFEQLGLTGGYDHNWVIDDYDGTLQLIARLEDSKSGRIMETYTDLPGVQLYAGNFIGTQTGKGNAQYGPRKGVCLETQFFPNSLNDPNFIKPLYGPEKEYHTTTVYKFVSFK